MNHHFELEYFYSGLYFVENNVINPFLQVGSGSIEKVMDPDQIGQKSTDLLK